MLRMNRRWCEGFLRIIFMAGGIICILIPAAELHGDSLSIIVLGITLIILGSGNIFTEGKTNPLKKKQRDIQEPIDHSVA